MKDIIVYVGGFRLPDGTASAQRALENANLFKSLGYHVVLMGKLDLERDGCDNPDVTYADIDGYDCYDIRHPVEGQVFLSYVSNIDSIKLIINKYGVGRVSAVIAYNYPSGALNRLIKFTHKNNIKMIAECTEWYGFEGKNIFRNLTRMFQTEFRMRYLAPKAGNVICASLHSQKHFSQCNTVVLPFVIDTAASKWKVPARFSGSTPRRFIYAGSPGMGMSKDYVHLVIDAFTGVRQAGYDFEFVVVGITKEQFLQAFSESKNNVDTLGPQLKFLGRIPHQNAIGEISQSDFFVFLRPENRVSQFGFPTKLVEAFSCGVPTITNATSDIGLYVQNLENGFLLERPDTKELITTIITALTIDDNKLDTMKNDCLKNNPFRFENFKEPVREFLLNAR